MQSESSEIDPALYRSLSEWASEVAQVRDEDIIAGADDDSKARVRDNMAAATRQLALVADRWSAVLGRARELHLKFVRGEPIMRETGQLLGAILGPEEWNAELAVTRRLLAASLPGGEDEYWQRVDRELRS